MNEITQHIMTAAAAHGWVREPEAKEILKSHGVPLGDYAWARTAAEVASLPASLFPAAVKAVSYDIMHKVDHDAVALNVPDPAAAAACFQRYAKLPGFDGIMVQAMARGTELIVGAKRDAQFGAVVMVGIGGVNVEIFRDVKFLLAPVTAAEAIAALRSLKGARLLEGHRGAPPADLSRAGELVAAFSRAAHELGDTVESIDLNPVIVNDRAIAVADARIILRTDQG